MPLELGNRGEQTSGHVQTVSLVTAKIEVFRVIRRRGVAKFQEENRGLPIERDLQKLIGQLRKIDCGKIDGRLIGRGKIDADACPQNQGDQKIGGAGWNRTTGEGFAGPSLSQLGYRASSPYAQTRIHKSLKLCARCRRKV